MTQYSNRNHIARATLESVCFQSNEVIDAMCKDSGVSLKQLKVDGGMTKSDLTLQIQADVSDIEVGRNIYSIFFNFFSINNQYFF